MSDTTPLLPYSFAFQIHNLSLERQGKTLLHIQNWNLLPNEWAYFLGPNGSGKTTLFQILLGQLPLPQNAQIEILGENLQQLNPENLHRLRRRIGFCSATWEWLPNLSIRQNWDLLLQATDWQLPQQRDLRIKHLLDLLPQAETWSLQPFHTLPKHQACYALLGRALLNQPQLLLVDQLDNGLSPDKALEFRHFLRQYQNRQGLAVVLATHQSQWTEEQAGTVFYFNTSSES